MYLKICVGLSSGCLLSEVLVEELDVQITNVSSLLELTSFLHAPTVPPLLAMKVLRTKHKVQASELHEISSLFP